MIGARPYTVRRYEQTLVSGEYQLSLVDEWSIIAVLMPLTNRDREQLEDGPYRTNGQYKLFAPMNVDLRVTGESSASGVQADRVVVDGEEFEVFAEANYSNAVLNGPLSSRVKHRRYYLQAKAGSAL